MTEYLYLAASQFGDIKIAKIGVSRSPRDRLRSAFQTAPVPLTEVLLRAFEHRAEANAWEAMIIACANRYRDCGEWVLDDDHLRSLWGSIDTGKAAHIDMTYSGRVIQPKAVVEDRRAIFLAKLRGQVGLSAAVRSKYRGDPEGYDRAVINARLIQGYGVEDMAVMDDLDPGVIRDEIHRLRVTEQLSAIYGLPRNAA